MKLQSIVRAALIAAVAILSTFSLSAQNEPSPRPKKTPEEHQQRRQDDMARELNLTPEQKEKFAQTDKTYNDKMKAAHSARKEDMEKLRREREQAHRSILNKDQAAKYDKMMADKKAKRDDHRQHKAGKKPGKAKKSGRTPAPAPAPGDAGDKSRKG